MGDKYRITAFNYPWVGYYDHNYGTESFIKLLIKLISWKIKYYGITVEIRK